MRTFKQVMTKAALAAGQHQMKHFYHLKREKIKLKKFREIVTEVDLGSEKIIVREIKKHFPKHNILSEEKASVDHGSDYTWLIDPLDGTTNYSIKSPVFGISIGLKYKNEIIEGIIYLPYLQELFYAKKGKGAFINGRKIRVSDKKNIKKSIITLSFSHRKKSTYKALDIFKKMRPYVLNIRMFGSVVFSYSLVASGSVEALFLPPLINPWDIGAGILLVEEAGGKVTDLNGKPWHFKSNSFLLSNGKVHQQILKKLK